MGPRLRTAASAFAGAFVLVLPVAAMLHGGGGDPDDWLVMTPPSQSSAGDPTLYAATRRSCPTPTSRRRDGWPTDPEVVEAGHQVPIGDLSILATVLEAYRLAADRLAREDPSCGLRWQILAGIGKIESGHANGGRVTGRGDAVPTDPRPDPERRRTGRGHLRSRRRPGGTAVRNGTAPSGRCSSSRAPGRGSASTGRATVWPTPTTCSTRRSRRALPVRRRR